MSSELKRSGFIEEHLERALEEAESDETKYQLREALQKLYLSN